MTSATRCLIAIPRYMPNYKHTWGDIRKIADAAEQTRKIAFKAHAIDL